MTVRIGVDRGDASVERLEHDLLHALRGLGPDLGPAGAPLYVCTHQVRDGQPHWAASIELAARCGPVGPRQPERAGGPLGSLELLRQLAGALAEPPHDDDLHRLAFTDPHVPDAPAPGAPSIAAVGEPGEEEVALGAERWRRSARAAATDLRARAAGRAVLFPGAADLPAELSVAELRAVTPIRELLTVGTTAGDSTVLETHGHVRPTIVDGGLALVVTPAGPGRVRPFELPVPRQCCETPDQYAARQAVYAHVFTR
ncbi:MAG: hypothetical protein V7637_4313 [Mycobacteriales bacterium]